MATLVRASINYADEFDTYGFAVFMSRQEAEDFISKAVFLSKGDDEFVYFGTNEYMGDFRRGQFTMTELTSDGVALLDSLFFNPYTNMISYGIMSNIISAIMENDNDDIDEDNGSADSNGEDVEESSITVTSEWGTFVTICPDGEIL